MNLNELVKEICIFEQRLVLTIEALDAILQAPIKREQMWLIANKALVNERGSNKNAD